MGPILDHARAGGLLCVDTDGTGCCGTCGVELSPCSCGGIGYHLDGCDESEDTITGRSPFRMFVGEVYGDIRMPVGSHLGTFSLSLDELAFLAGRDVRRHQGVA